MTTENPTTGSSLAYPRCLKAVTDLSLRIRKCTSCGCTLTMAIRSEKLWDEAALLRLAIVAICQRFSQSGTIELLEDDLARAAASDASVSTDGRAVRVRVRF